MVYISPDAKDFFLSKEAMIQLGIIDANFPQLGAALVCSEPIACQAIGNDSVVEHLQTPMNIKEWLFKEAAPSLNPRLPIIPYHSRK